MNERIQELAEQAFAPINDMASEGIADRSTFNMHWFRLYNQKFAELIVRECVNQCRQEWYDLNNAVPKENETLRDIGIRVGQKNGVLKTISRIKEHFGIEQ